MKCSCCRYLKEERVFLSSIFVCEKCDKSIKAGEVAAYFYVRGNMRVIRYIIVPFLITASFIAPVQWIAIVVNIVLGFYVMPKILRRRNLPTREEVSDEILIANLKS